MSDTPYLEGVIPPLVTPFSMEGELDPDALERQVRWLSGRGLAGVLALGSTGEAPLLDRGERREVIAVCAAAREPGTWLLAGTGAESTRQTVALGRDAAEAGADILLVVNPSFYRGQLGLEELEAHFRAVADEAPLPVLLYSVPAFTGAALAPDLVERLATHPRIIGLKDSSGDLRSLHTFLERTPPRFNVITGSPLITGAAGAAGASGAILAVANFAPEWCVALLEAGQTGDLERMRTLQTEVSALTRRIQGAWGIAGIKTAVDLAGGAGGAPRAPLRALDARRRARVAEALAEAGIAAGR